ncbi:MAG: aldo/keto reductase [Acholeplasmataceae bacterium]
MKQYTLSNGVKIPALGFGTWQIKDGQEAIDAVKEAIKQGFRHIDTAAIYGNETGVGQGIIDSGIPREEIFLTTKLWNSDQGYESTLKAFELSLKKLKTDYVDLYLIHWPAVNLHKDYKQKNLDTWRAFEELYKKGKVKAIGVCNYFEHHMDYLLEHATIKPMVNQIEINPGHPAFSVVEHNQKHGILVQGYSPMMKGKIFELPELKVIADKHKKTVSQVVLRWLIQRDINPLSKSITPKRIHENIDIFDFELTKSDMDVLNAFEHLGRVGVHPDDAQF